MGWRSTESKYFIGRLGSFFYCFVFAVCCVFFPLISLRFSCGILPGVTTMTLISLMTTELLLSGFFGCPNSEEDFIIPTQ